MPLQAGLAREHGSTILTFVLQQLAAHLSVDAQQVMLQTDSVAKLGTTHVAQRAAFTDVEQVGAVLLCQFLAV